MKNLFDLKDKTAVVTGGAGLLGREFVKGLASAGAKVFAADVDQKTGESLCSELAGEGLETVFVHLDIADEKSVCSCIENVKELGGSIDIWINNAYPRTKDWGLKFEDIPLESWNRNCANHLGGYFLCCQKAAEEMKVSGGGSIINMASIYGISAPDFSVYDGTDMTMPAAYSAIKGAIVNFTKYVASYYGYKGVRVNCVSPGGIFDNQPAQFVKNYNKRVPLGRMAGPEDIVGAVIYLSSDASQYVTGHNLVVDGGWSVI